MTNKATAFFTEPIAPGVHEATVMRYGKNQIRISTLEPISDEQMSELMWIVTLMVKTKLPLKEILKQNGIGKA